MGDCFESAKAITVVVVEKIEEVLGKRQTGIRNSEFIGYFTRMIKENATGKEPLDKSRSGVLNLPEIMEESKEIKEKMNALDLEPTPEGIGLYVFARFLELKREEIEEFLNPENIKKIGLFYDLEEDIELMPENKIELMLSHSFNEDDTRKMMLAMVYYKKENKLVDDFWYHFL